MTKHSGPLGKNISRVAKRTPQEDRELALTQRKALSQKLIHRPHKEAPAKSAVKVTIGSDAMSSAASVAVPAVAAAETFGLAQIPFYRDDEDEASTVSPALETLVNLYLQAARQRTRHIAMLWPSAPHALSITHVVATLERWARGDKLGVRGLMLPAKGNAFYPLNHLHLDNDALLVLAKKLREQPGEANPFVTRPLFDKDTFLFSVASLKPEERQSFKPTMGELIPHFLGGQGFSEWPACGDHLLAQTSFRLTNRSHGKALRKGPSQQFGQPDAAPDAIFALDLRMTKDERQRALRKLKKVGSPEVLLVNVTRKVRLETNGWARQIVRALIQIEDALGSPRPGMVIVLDEPQAAYQLQHELKSQNAERDSSKQWAFPRDFWITAVCNGLKEDGLLPAGITQLETPVPREYDLEIVDTEAAQIINSLYRIVSRLPGGRDSGQPLLEAAKYLAKLAALPCGVRDIVAWLSESTASERDRRLFSWGTFHGAAMQFAQSAEAGAERGAIEKALAKATTLYAHYSEATPFALRLAELVSACNQSGKRKRILVFTSARYRRFAERFLGRQDFGDGVVFAQFADRVTLLMSSKLEEYLEHVDGTPLIFVGLDDEGLRLLMMDNRIVKHSVILITQRSAQYLRNVLRPLHDNFEEFRAIKPRMASFLRQFAELPNDQSILRDDFTLPVFRNELSSDVSASGSSEDPEAWEIVVEGGQAFHWRPAHYAYVYDPVDPGAGSRGFRRCEVKSLSPGDKLFVMSAELRELVEAVLRDAGVPISHDKTYEELFRDYQDKVIVALKQHFPATRPRDQVRYLRNEILSLTPEVAKGYPEEASVLYWVSQVDTRNMPFEEITTRAPQREAHFQAFAKALQIPDLMAAYFWQQVIMAIRNARRADGRHVSEIYTSMLFQPESTMLLANISRATIKMLFEHARDNAIPIERIIPAEERECHAR